MGLRILRRKDVEKKVKLCQATIYTKMNNGSFPKSIKLGPKTVGWIESEIDDWILEKMKERDERTV